MRTNIEIDDKLHESGTPPLLKLKTKRAVVEAALAMLVRVKRQEGILALAGKVHWDGDLNEMRQGRNFLMILVDSSVWIDHLNNHSTEQVRRLRAYIPSDPLLIGDLILCEVLQGIRSEAAARLVKSGTGSI